MLKKIQIFKAGRYGESSNRIWNDEEVAELQNNFDNSFRRAPVKLGHDGFLENEKPAVGWVEDLELNNGVLEANVNFADDEIKNIKDKYINVSVEVVKHIEEYDKETDKRGSYLLGVALLGSSQPAVAGLAPVKFSKDSETKEENFYTTDLGIEKADLFQTKKDDTIQLNKQGENEMQEKLEAFKKQNDELQKQLEAFKQKERVATVETFISANAKKIVPAVKDDMQEFMLGLDDKQMESFKKIVEKIPEVEIFKNDLDETEEPQHKDVKSAVDEAMKDLEVFKKQNK
jgi:cytochrome c553